MVKRDKNAPASDNITFLTGELVLIEDPWKYVHPSGLVFHNDTYSILQPLTKEDMLETKLWRKSNQWWFYIKHHARFNDNKMTAKAQKNDGSSVYVDAVAGPGLDGAYGLDFHHEGGKIFSLWPGKWVFENLEYIEGDLDEMHPTFPLPMTLGKELERLLDCNTKDNRAEYRDRTEVIYWRQTAAINNKVSFDYVHPSETTSPDNLHSKIPSMEDKEITDMEKSEKSDFPDLPTESLGVSIQVETPKASGSPSAPETPNSSGSSPSSLKRRRNFEARDAVDKTLAVQNSRGIKKEIQKCLNSKEFKKGYASFHQETPVLSTGQTSLGSDNQENEDEIEISPGGSTTIRQFSMYSSVRTIPGQEHVKVDILNGALEIHNFKVYSGDLVQVQFKGDKNTQLHTEKFRWYFNPLILEALRQIEKHGQGKCDLRTSSLVKYPTLFWNCFLRGEGKGVEKGLANIGWTTIRISKSFGMYNFDSSDYSDTSPLAPSPPKEIPSLEELQKRRQEERKIMEAKVMEQVMDTARLRIELYKSKARRGNLPEDEGSHYSRRSRRRTSSLISADYSDSSGVLDSDGFPLVILEKLPFSQRRKIYKICCENNWIAPLLPKWNEKGRAVYSAAKLLKGDFLCRYEGEFVRSKAAMQLKTRLHEEMGAGCFMFYFLSPYNGQFTCVDATEESWTYGVARLVNHSHQRPNVHAMAIPYDEKNQEPALVFICKRDINENEELLIDYGETDKRVLANNPWLLA